MNHRRSSRAVAIVTVVWLLAAVAAIAMATTDDSVALAQPGCTGGGSSASPSRSASPSESEPGFPPTGVPSVPSLIPNGGPDPRPQPPQARAQQVEPQQAAEVQPFDPYEKVPVAAAQQGINCKSTVTIDYASGNRPAFKGKVGSGEPMCKRARKVAVKKVKEGKDQTVARGVTNAKGAYTAPEANAKGKYYALVAKSTTENGDGESVTCAPARSKTIKV